MVAFPKTDYQHCMVHMVRNTLKYVASKGMKSFAVDLRTIYNAASEDEGRKARDWVVEKWSSKYPNSMKRWIENWDVVVPIFKFSKDVRKIIYTTNEIESLKSCCRKLNRQRNDQVLLKALSLYLDTFEATKKWTLPIHNRGQAYDEICIMYEVHLSD